MLIARDAVADIVGERRRRLADAAGVVAVAAAAGGARDQRGSDQTLRVDDRVVIAGAQRPPEFADLTPGRSPRQRPPPPPRCDRNDVVDRGMQTHERRERLLHHPRKAQGRAPRARLGHRRHVVNDIAKRRSLDEQNVGHGRPSPLGNPNLRARSGRAPKALAIYAGSGLVTGPRSAPCMDNKICTNRAVTGFSGDFGIAICQQGRTHDDPGYRRRRLHRQSHGARAGRCRRACGRARQPVDRIRMGGAEGRAAGAGRDRRSAAGRRLDCRAPGRLHHPFRGVDRGAGLGPRSARLLSQQHGELARAARGRRDQRGAAVHLFLDRGGLRQSRHGAGERGCAARADVALRQFQADDRDDAQGRRRGV